ncbi:HYR domain-containing protein [Flaviaesturariibacter flavus]|uniref:HYR domain-containing protein n=1 Tax=Flaviaesturariibacter flavus TaxID=2502780 RepID=A0A4R1BBH9_9BACT|nr:HYR domain-containing protein [Flaviaesturariibacter flavus]TCJ14349.1 HYR domain-containing protein [Flaviaesturariibacter flavus]
MISSTLTATPLTKNRGRNFKKAKLTLFTFLFLFAALAAEASHFRYGNISWRWVSGRTIEFKVSQAYRRSYTTTFTNAVVGSTVSGIGSLNFGDNSAGTINLVVSSVNVAEDWIYGEATLTHTYATDATFTAFFSGSARLSNLQNNWDLAYRQEVKVTIGGAVLGNSGPVSGMPPTVNVPLNRQATFQLAATDPDGDALTYRLATSAEMGGTGTHTRNGVTTTVDQTPPPSMTVSPGGLVSFNTTSSTAGMALNNLYSAAFVVTDARGATTMIDLMILIVQPSTPPAFDYTLTPASGTVYDVQPGQTVTFSVRASDVDAGDRVASLTAVGLPAGVSVSPALPVNGNPATVSFSWTPTQAQLGNRVISFTAQDNTGNQTTTTVTIIVSMNPVFNVPPTPAADYGFVVAPGTLFSTPIQAQAPDPAVNLRIVSASVPAGASFSPALPSTSGNTSTTTLSWTPTVSAWGDHTLTFTATDALGKSKTHSFDILVNTTPAFTSTNPNAVSISENQPFSYNVSVADQDIAAGDVVNLVALGMPSWLTFTQTGPLTGVFSGTPGAGSAGVENISIIAEDVHHHDHEEVRQDFTITVNACTFTTAVTPASASICAGKSVTLTAPAADSYSWSTGETTASITVSPLSATTYTVTATSGYCTATAGATVNVNPLPVVAASSNSPVNAGSTINLSASGANTYIWNGPAAFIANGAVVSVPNAQPVNGGLYTVTGTTTQGCSATASASVAVNPAAGALKFNGRWINVNTTLGNFGTSDFTIDFAIRTTQASGTYLMGKRSICDGQNFWNIGMTSNGKINIEFDDPSNGEYFGLNGIKSVNNGQWHTVAVTRQGSVYSIYVDGLLDNSITRSVNANYTNPYTLQIGNNICINQNGSIRFVGDLDEIRFWNRGLCLDELNTYRSKELAFTSGNGLVADYKLNQGFIGADNSGILTVIDATGQNNGTLTGAATWIDGYASGIAGTYVAPVATATAATATTFCQGGSVVLSAAPATGVTFQWYRNGAAINGATAATYSAIASGSYSVVTSSTGLCKATSNSIAVVVNAMPVVTASSSAASICAGGSATITASGASTYSWSNGATGAVLTVSAPGTYTVTGTSNGCSVTSAPVVITQNSAPSINGVNVYLQGSTAADACTAIINYPVTVSGTPAPVVTYTFTGATNATGNGTGSGAAFSKGVTHVKITAVNGCGAPSAEFDVTVVDDVRPTAVCKPATLVLDASGQAALNAAMIDNGSSDNCGPVTVSISREGTICGTAAENGTITLRAPAGTVIDRIDFASYGTPNGSCGNFTQGGCHAFNSKSVVESLALGRNTATISATNGVFGDPCGGTVKRLYIQAHYSSATGNATNFDCNNIGNNEVILTVTDAAGNVSTCTANVTVMDNSAPVPNIASLPVLNGQCSVTATAPTATDNCSGMVTATTTDPVSYSQQGTYTINWVYRDASGNTTPQAQQVVVKDITAPVANVAVLPVVTAECATTVAAPTATDNCRGTIVATTTDPTTYSAQGTYVINWVYNDGNGNSSTQQQTVIIKDVTAPVFTGVTSTGNVPAAVLANVPEANQYNLVYALDIPADAAWSNSTAVPYAINNAAALAGQPFARVAYYMQLDNKWVWVSMDKFTGNVAQTGIPSVGNTFFQQRVTNMNVFASANAGVTTGTGISTGNIEFWNNCYGTTNGLGLPGANSVKYDFDDLRTATSPSCYGSFQVHNYAIGQTLFAYNRWAAGGADDLGIGNNTGSSGHPDWTYQYNAATYGTRKLYVFISAGSSNDISTTTDANSCSANVAVSAPTATDNCGAATVAGVRSDNQALSAVYPKGLTTITWTATDAVGNRSTTMQTVTVSDKTAPVPTVATLPVLNGQCSVTAIAPTASDNCSGVVTATTVNPTTYSQQGTYSIRWTYTDADGNNSFQDQTVIVKDVTAPVLVGVPANTTVECDAVPVPATVTATDNCSAGAVTFSEVRTNGNCPSDYKLTRTWRVTDIGNNTTTATQVITVQDTQAPSLTVSDVNTVSDAGQCGAIVMMTAKATDNCGMATISWSRNPGTFFPVGETVVTVTATDACGNQTVKTITVTVADKDAPVVRTRNSSIQLDAAGVATIAEAAVDNGSSDNCAIASVELNKTSFDCSNVGPNTVTLTVTDIHGNVSSATAVVTVEDKVAPVITCPASLTLNCQDDHSVAATGLATATDACGVASITYADASTQSADVSNAAHYNYTITRTWTAVDNHGNSSSCVQVITVQDITAPVVVTAVQSLDRTEECSDAAAIAAALALAPAATDNCAPVEMHLVSDVTTAACGSTYTRVRTWNFTDVSGNTSETFVQTITVRDTQAPSLDVTNVTITNDAGHCGAIVGFAALASDNCGSPSVVYSQNPGTYFAVGTTTVTATATDACGNTTVKTFTVTVNDTEVPVVRTQNLTIQLDASGAASITAAQADNGSTDNCAIATKEVSKTAFDCSNVGANTVTLTVTDIHGNVNTATVLITVEDKVAPVITCPAAVTLNCQDDNSSAATGVATATDACGVASITSSDVSSQSADINSAAHYNYTITRTWAAVDNHGNQSQCVQLITVQDVTVPVITTVTSDLDRTVECSDANAIAAALTLAPAATDNCAPVSIHLVSDVTTANCGTTYTRVRQWNFTDPSNNTSVLFTQTVKVVDRTAPVVTVNAGAIEHCFDSTSTSYPVPSLAATDNCNAVSYSYVVKGANGAVVRSGAGSNASGVFPVGNNSIYWTVTDACGNSTPALTTVRINAPITAAFSSFTALGGGANTIYMSSYAPAASAPIKITAAGGTAPYTYAWTIQGGAAATFTVNADRSSITASAVGQGTVVIACVVTDAKGCQAIFRKTITVIDVRCGNKGEKVMVCQNTGSAKNPWVQICIAPEAVATHLNKGSYLGACTGSAVTRTINGQQPEVEAMADASVVAYPNPSRGIVNLRIAGITGNVQLAVVDSRGNTVARRAATVSSRQENVQLDLQTVAAGFYTIRVSNGTKVLNARVVIAR